MIAIIGTMLGIVLGYILGRIIMDSKKTINSICGLSSITLEANAGELTNGDMMKIIFPDVEVEAVKLGGQIVGYDISKLDKGSCAETYFTKTWWNAPYFAEREE